MSDFPFILIQTKDLRHIPDYAALSDSTLRRRMISIRSYVGKEAHQPVTIFDLSSYLGIEVTDLRKIMTIRKQAS